MALSSMRPILLETLENLPEFTHPQIDLGALQEELKADRHSIEPAKLPRLYQFETTAKCNLSCPFCPRTIDLVPNNRRDMSATVKLDDFCRVLDQMPWLKSLELFHFGEPFMQNDFHEFVQACTDRGIYSVVASNLLPATERKLDLAFNAGLNFLVMDVDSLDADRYAKARVGGTLARLQKVVRYVLAHPQKPWCVAQTIMLKGKPEYTMQEFLEWSGGLAPDEIRYKFLDSFRGFVTNKGTLGEEEVCREAFYGFTVHANGNVVPCDRDWAGENVMGNVFEQDVMAIWHGEKFAQFRAAMKSKDKPAMCKGCKEGRLVNARSQPHIQVNMFKGAEVYHER
jgi:radical SAM protein with 4Fe4S-binding SPASM domain